VFIHAGVVPLAGSLFGLALLGPVAEGLWARWRFTGLFALSGLGSAVAAVATHPEAVVAGAGGAVWGVELAVLAWLTRYREHLPMAMTAEWARRLALVVGVSLVVSLLPNTPWEGHLAGGVVGVAAAVFLDLTRPGATRRQIGIGVSGLVVLLVGMAVGLAVAVHYAPVWESVPPTRGLSVVGRELVNVIQAGRADPVAVTHPEILAQVGGHPSGRVGLVRYGRAVPAQHQSRGRFGRRTLNRLEDCRFGEPDDGILADLSGGVGGRGHGR
jgi:hypothetical protein